MPAPPRHGHALAARVLAVVGLVALGGCGVQGTDAAPRPAQTSQPSAPVEPTPSTIAPVEPTPSTIAPVEPTPSSIAPPTTTSTPTPAPSASVDHGPALASATWGDNEGGRSLAVVPAPWVRTTQDPTAVGRLWAELVEAVPEADTASMHDQLVCHAIGAPDKDSWNLEPWRPDVGLVAVMGARCNPR